MDNKAPLKRPLVTVGRKTPHKIGKLLDDPVVCSRIAAAWPALREISVAVIMDLPLFCKEHELDPAAVVLAANKLFTTLEVFQNQAMLDRESAPDNSNEKE